LIIARKIYFCVANSANKPSSSSEK